MFHLVCLAGTASLTDFTLLKRETWFCSTNTSLLIVLIVKCYWINKNRSISTPNHTSHSLKTCLVFIVQDYRPSYRIVASEAQLNGSDRFVADGLATRAQCKLLIGLARAFAVSGDGYDGKQSPHTLAERFAGVTLTRAILLTYYDLIGDRYLRNYLQVTESVRQRVRDYFQLHERPLHFSFTHLVCRSALGGVSSRVLRETLFKRLSFNVSGWKGRREEYSHAIHADNCNVQPDGRCERGEPAYTWRDYSAILYLNGDFDGGEFVFAADPLGARIQVRDSFANWKV